MSEYLVGSPAFKAGRDGRSPSGGFDSRPPPPEFLGTRLRCITALQNDLGRVYTYGYEETNPADHCGRLGGVRSEKSSLGLNLSPLQRSLSMPSPLREQALPVREQFGQFWNSAKFTVAFCVFLCT